VILRIQQHRRGGFTLIELIISAALMAIVIGSAYMCLSAGVNGQRLIEARAEGVQSARTALNIMAADLRSAIPMSGNTNFLGMRRTVEGIDADNLDFSTRNYEPKRTREPDYCETSYFLTKDRESDSYLLIRRRDPTPDPEPLEGGTQQEIARGVRGLRIEYYDGFDWFDDWGDPEGKARGMLIPPSNSSGLPEAVRITIVFDPETKPKKRDVASQAKAETEEEKAPMTFQTVAHVELAGLYNRQASAQSSANNNSEGGQQQQQQQQAAPEGVIPQ
jgi:type II secretion system protein J